MLMFIITLFLADGTPLVSSTPAVIHKGQRPITKMKICQEEANAMQKRIRVAIDEGNGLFTNVTIHCKRK